MLAEFVDETYGTRVKYIADIAGGQGLLARVLTKRFNYECDVIDPRGWALKGVSSRAEEFDPAMAAYYDLIVGMHPDEAVRAVARAALVRPVILIPCCNFWSEELLGRDELVEAIETYYTRHGVTFKRVVFPFKGPKNVGIVSEPPTLSQCQQLQSPAGRSG